MNGSAAEPKPSRAAWWLVLIPVLVVSASWWFVFDPQQLPEGFDSSRVPQNTPPVVPAAASSPAPPAPKNAPDASPRTADAPSPAPVAEFTCTDEDGKPIENPVRDGLVLSLRTMAGAPCAGVAVDVTWRKGFGLYGHDRGRTDATGRFPTTVAQTDQFELLEFQHERAGALTFSESLVVSAADPRVIDFVVPDLAPLRVRVVDGKGGPIARAKVTANGGAQADAPRQHVLWPGEARDAVTDDDGTATSLLCHGIYTVTAEAANCTAPQPVRAVVDANGGDATVVLSRAEDRIDVDVRLTLPPGVTAPRVSAWTTEAPPRTAAMHGRGLEPQRREFFVDRQSDTHFVVRTEDCGWRVQAAAKGCMAAIADIPRGQREVALVLTPMPAPAAEPPKARIIVTVVGYDRKSVFPEVRVHETADYVHGSDHPTDSDGRVVFVREPKGRVCVSARAHRLPWVVSEPIDLVPGDHEVTLQLVPAQKVFGRVVDAQGNGVTCRVALKRPAGPLRGLDPSLGDVIENGPTEDHYDGVLDGVFRFEACGPGEHVVWAFPERGWPARKRVTPGVETTIVVGEGLDDYARVEGVVRDETTLLPLAGVVISASTDMGGWHNETDAEGRFRVVARPGVMEVRLRKRGYVLHTTSTQDLPRGPVQIELKLPPSRVLFVRVLDAAGAPIAGAEVGVLGPDGEPRELLDDAGNPGDDSETTNANGRVDLRGAPLGALRLRVEIGDEKRDFDVPATAGRDGVFDVRW